MDGVTGIFDLLQVAGHLHQDCEPIFFGKENSEVFAIDSQTYHRNSFNLDHTLLDSGIKTG